MRRKGYRRLTIAQAKQGLAAGYHLMAAEGDVFFPTSRVMHEPLNLPSTMIHRATFDHLRANGLIDLNESLSQLPPENSVWSAIRGTKNYYAIWEPTDKLS